MPDTSSPDGVEQMLINRWHLTRKARRERKKQQRKQAREAQIEQFISRVKADWAQLFEKFWNSEVAPDERQGTRRDAEEALKHHYWRLQVLEKDHRTCKRCDTTEFPEAHHVEAWSRAPELRYDPDNGAVLCYECHKLFHRVYGRDKFEEFVTLQGPARWRRPTVLPTYSLQ